MFFSKYSGSQLSEVQEPHPQPPPRSSRGGYDAPHLIRKSYRLLKLAQLEAYLANLTATLSEHCRY